LGRLGNRGPRTGGYAHAENSEETTGYFAASNVTWPDAVETTESFTLWKIHIHFRNIGRMKRSKIHSARFKKRPTHASGNNGPEIGGAASDEIKDWPAYEIEHIERLNLAVHASNKQETDGVRTKNKSLASGQRKTTKRPPGNWAVSSFQGRIVPTEVRINPSELSGEILWVPERQCQGISPQ